MNHARIRYFVQPPMSVVDRNLSTTSEGMMMTTSTAMMVTSTALPLRTSRGTSHQGAVQYLVSRLAVSMLRWSEASSDRRLAGIERSVPVRVAARVGGAAEYAHTVRNMRLG